MTDLWRMGAWELAERVRAREVSSREVVEAHLRRIDDVNPRVNAITAVLAEEAIAAADAADAANVPLGGVPMTIKENIDVAGSATTFGIVPLREAVAGRDSPHIAELRAAGAIPIGRTNMPELGMRWHTDNALHGATRNPWSAGHTPGASSGGDAAAVATGMTPLGMGNDGAGSLRWPAQCCGVAALRPSLGRVPLTGRKPGPRRPMPFAFQLFTVHGPIARQVRDLHLAFAHMCGRAGDDPWYAPVPLEGAPAPRPLRVAVVSDTGDELDAGVAGALRRAAGLLAGAGYVVEERTAPDLIRAGEVFAQIMLAYGRVTEVQPPVEAIAPSEDFVRFWQLYDPVWREASGRRAFDPMMERAAIARAWSDWMDETPLVLAPICARPAFPIGADLDPAWLAGWPAALRTTVVVNLLGLPAVAVPVGEDGGLPHAVQVIAPRFREDLCLAAAAAIEAGVPPLTPIDPRA